jgi:hypothetical protein
MTWSVEHVCAAKVQPHEVFRYYTDPSTWHRWGRRLLGKETRRLVEAIAADRPLS